MRTVIFAGALLASTIAAEAKCGVGFGGTLIEPTTEERTICEKMADATSVAQAWIEKRKVSGDIDVVTVRVETMRKFDAVEQWEFVQPFCKEFGFGNKRAVVVNFHTPEQVFQAKGQLNNLVMMNDVEWTKCGREKPRH